MGTIYIIEKYLNIIRMLGLLKHIIELLTQVTTRSLELLLSPNPKMKPVDSSPRRSANQRGQKSDYLYVPCMDIEMKSFSILRKR